MIQDVRVGVTVGARAFNHLALALGAVSRGRSRRWLAVGAASLAYDAWLVRQLRDPAFVPGWPQFVADAADVAVWTLSTDPGDPIGAHPASVATVSTAAAVGFWAGSGTEAVPVAAASQPFPPENSRQWRRLVTTSAGALLAAPLANIAVQRARGSKGTASLAFDTPVAIGFGFGLARYRAHLQRRAREQWQRDAQRGIAAEGAAEAVAATTDASPGHDFKKTLLMLGVQGSTAARRAGQEQLAHPARVVRSRAGGSTAFEAAIGLRIEPPNHARIWLSSRQADALEQFLDNALARAPDAYPDVALHLERQPGVGIICRYLGAETVLRNDSPPLLSRLDPTALGFIGGVWLAAMNFFPKIRALPIAPSIALMVIDGYGAARFWDRPPDSNHDRAVLLRFVAARAAVGLAASWGAPRRTAAGSRVFPPNPALASGLVLLSAMWSRLSQRQRLALPALYAGWLAAAVLPGGDRPSAPEVLVEACLQAAMWEFWQLRDLIDDETRYLDETLATEFDRLGAEARRESRCRSLDVHQHQLEIARRELAALPAAVRAELVSVESECDELEAWLATQRAALLSPPPT